MRSWLAPLTRRLLASLAALVLLGLLASPALAAFAHGLECTALGSCTVTSSPDESSLHVSNIGSSGNDGVSISLLGSDGHRCVCPSSWSSVTDVGAQVSFEWTQLDGPTIFTHSATMTRTSSGMTLGGSLWVIGGAQTHTLYLYEGDHLRSFDGLGYSSGLDIVLPSSSQLPVVEFERDGRQDVVVCSVTFPSLVTISGSSLQFDRAVMVSSFTSDGKITVCHARVTNPPGGSLSSVDISSQAPIRQGHAMASLGKLHFAGATPTSTTMVAFAIGSSGQDGVSITDSPLSIVRSSSSGSGGGGGGGAGGATWSSSRPSMMKFPSSSLVFTPGTDVGASLRCDVSGSSSCSPDGIVASLTTLCRSTDLLLSSSFSSMCADAESVHVSLNGVIVSSSAITLGGSVSVTPVPGGPLGMAINEKGLPGEKKPKTKPKTVTFDENGDPVNLVTVTDELSLRVQFASQIAAVLNGSVVIGDCVTFTGHRLSGGSPTVVVTGTNFTFAQSSTGTQVPSTVDVEDVSSSGGDQVSALSPPTGGLSTTVTTVQVPVLLQRVDTTPARGYSLTAQLSSNVVIGSIVEYDYLSGVGTTQMFVTDLGNNRYVIDCTILGDPCGATGSGVLFTVPVSAAPGATDGTATVTIEEVALRDCNNDPLPCDLGGSAFVTLDFTAPPAPTGVTATQVTTGNPAGSTTAITIDYTLFDSTRDAVEVYRASYGNYPEYDDAPGSGAVPVAPSGYPPGPQWTRLSLCYSTDCGANWVDQPLSRDAYYYVCYSVDNSGNWAQSSMTTGTLNYHLGDFSDGVASCTGDNHVDAADISALGSSYGALLTPGSSLACLDVGPTTNHRVSGRPMTDNKLNFEDLILSAINFSRVSAPGFRAQPVAAARNSVRIEAGAIPAVGETFEARVHMTGAGDVQGLSLQLDFDPAVVELVSVSPGELIGRQNRSGVVLAGGGGRVDGALLGDGGGIAGEGELARVAFRVRASGDARLGVASVDARDTQNREVPVALLTSPGPAPARNAIRYAYPNPFDRETRVEFMLPQRAPVTIGVFDVAGRHVRTLMEGVQEAGLQSANWDGRDARGVQREAGVYLIRFEAAGVRETRAVRLVR